MKQFSLNRRSAGILLPLFSLGGMGPRARRFVDFLQEAGMSWWQMLPINPTNRTRSPYQALSSFRGNPEFLDPKDSRPFDEQWRALKTYAHERGIGLIGDVPIFVAYESEDVRNNPEIFHLDAKGRMALQAGVPPDYFSRTGQLWGCPLYRWDVLKKTGYDWWIRRLEWNFEKFDAVRLDHFIGFYRAWAVPGNAKTAVQGRWFKGPREDFFEKIFAALGPLELIAEDLGFLIPPVKALRDQFGLPGMRVLQFAFGDDAEANNYLPHNYPERCVAYTGTHDNNTARGWFETEASPKERRFAEDYLKSDGRNIPWAMIEAVFKSRADLAIVPMQDVLGLGAKARINRPGTVKGNWKWRLDENLLDEKTARRLTLLCRETGRS